jgi:hypothetical protein
MINYNPFIRFARLARDVARIKFAARLTPEQKQAKADLKAKDKATAQAAKDEKARQKNMYKPNTRAAPSIDANDEQGKPVRVEPSILGTTNSKAAVPGREPEEKEALGINVPYTPSHKPLMLHNENHRGVIHKIWEDHKKVTASDSVFQEHKIQLWNAFKRAQATNPNIPALANLKEEHISDDPTERIAVIMQTLQDMHSKEKDPKKKLEIEHSLNSIWTGANQFVQDKRDQNGVDLQNGIEGRKGQFYPGTSTGIGAPICSNGKSSSGNKVKVPEEEEGDEEDDKEDSRTKEVKSLLFSLSAAFAPEMTEGYQALREHIVKGKKPKLATPLEKFKSKNPNKPEGTPGEQRAYSERQIKYNDSEAARNTYNDNISHILTLEAARSKLAMSGAVGYGSNIQTNLDFLNWYSKDGRKHDINLVNLVNTHPEFKLMRGMLGTISEPDGDGKKRLDQTEEQMHASMIFKLLLGPTSSNLTPIANSETALKIFQDGYYNYVSRYKAKNPGAPIPKPSMTLILKNASLDKGNLGAQMELTDVGEDKKHFLDAEGNSLAGSPARPGIKAVKADPTKNIEASPAVKAQKYPIYVRNASGEIVPKNSKWMLRPTSTEEFLSFVQNESSGMTDDKSMIDHYLNKVHEINAEGQRKEIADKEFYEAKQLDPNKNITFEEAKALPGVFGLGKKFGPYVLSMMAEYLHHFGDGAMNAPFVADRVMTEYFGRWMNTVFGGAPENDRQRAAFAHSLIQATKELGYMEVRDHPHGGAPIEIPRVDMLQGHLWSNHQGTVRAFGGTNPSSYLSHGVISFADKAQKSALHRSASLLGQNDQVERPHDTTHGRELEDWAKNYKHIQEGDMHETKEVLEKRASQRAAAEGFRGGAYKISQETLQRILPRLQLKRRSTSTGDDGDGTKRTERPIKFAQFTQAPGGMTGTPVATRTNQPFSNAVAKSPGGKNLAQGALGNQINSKGGVNTTAQNAVGDWPNGSEESIVHTAPQGTDPARLKYLAAWHGISGQKKSVLVFHPNPKGPDSLYHMVHPSTDMGEVREQLIAAGINYKTLLPGKTSTRVMVYDPNRGMRNTIDQYATNNNLNVEENIGQGEIVGHNGDWNSAGALPKSRQAYTNIIGEYESNSNQAGPANNTSGAPTNGTGTSTGQAQQLSRKTKAKIKFDRSRRVLEGFLRQHNTPNKELPPVGDLLSQDLQNIKPEHLSKYQQLIPDAKWSDIEGAVTSLQKDPSLYDDMTSESNRREMYCKEHARTVLQSSGLKKLIDSLRVQNLIPEHAQHLIEDAKDGDYFSLEAISSELQHSVPSLRAFSKAAEKEYNKAGKAWDKMRTGPQPQKFAKKSAHAKDQYRAGAHGITFRGRNYNGGQFAPQNDGVKRFEKDSNVTAAIKKLRGV